MIEEKEGGEGERLVLTTAPINWHPSERGHLVRRCLHVQLIHPEVADAHLT